MNRSPTNLAGWVRRQAAALLDELDALDGRPPSRELRERLQATERCLRLPAPRDLGVHERASRLAAAAGLTWPPQTFADSPN